MRMLSNQVLLHNFVIEALNLGPLDYNASTLTTWPRFLQCLYSWVLSKCEGMYMQKGNQAKGKDGLV